MDVEREMSTAPSSPPPGDSTMAGSFAADGVADGNTGPTPPPHRTPPPSSSPLRSTVDAEACKAAGNKFFKQRDYIKAVQEYSKAIDADPQNATYLSNRSAAWMSANRYLEALEDARDADAIEPGNPRVQLRLGRIYTALGRPQEAVETYSAMTPPASAKDQAPAVLMQQHINEAEKALQEGTTGSMILHGLDQAEKGLGLGVDKPRKWKLLRGEAYLRLGNQHALGEAQNLAMSMLRINNQDPDALVLRGRALYANGDNDKAIQHFRQALSGDPDFKDAVKYLRMVQKLDRMKEEGNAAFKSGRNEEAIKTYTAALEVDPNNKGTNSKLLHNRALASIKVCQSSYLLNSDRPN